MSLNKRRGHPFITGAMACAVAGVLAVGCMNKNGAEREGGEDPAKTDPAAASSWQAPSSWVKKKNPVPADAESIAAGKKVFAQNCVVCHGETGKGNGPAAAGLHPKPADLGGPALSKQTDGALFWKVEQGHGSMPSFKSTLTDKQVWDVVNYVRSLSAKS
jgi:mono/diheme cytochrome c family protein